MDKNTVVINEYYHLVFKPQWDYFTGDYKIIGYSSPDVVMELDNKNTIKKTYFKDLGLSDDDYNQNISQDSLVYIAVQVTSKDPIEENPVSKRVFLPAPLILFSNSYKYIGARRFDFSVSTSEKLFDNKMAEDEWLKEKNLEIKDAINNLDDFSSDTVSVTGKGIDVLTTKTIIDELTEKRELNKSKKLVILKQNRDNLEATQRNLEVKAQAAEAQESKYKQKSSELVEAISKANEAYETNNSQKDRLDATRLIMIEMLRKIISGEKTIDTSTSAEDQFDAMYEEASQSIG